MKFQKAPFTYVHDYRIWSTVRVTRSFRLLWKINTIIKRFTNTNFMSWEAKKNISSTLKSLSSLQKTLFLMSVGKWFLDAIQWKLLPLSTFWGTFQLLDDPTAVGRLPKQFFDDRTVFSDTKLPYNYLGLHWKLCSRHNNMLKWFPNLMTSITAILTRRG